MNIEELLNQGKYLDVVNYYRKSEPTTAQDFLAFGISLFYIGLIDEAIKIL